MQLNNKGMVSFERNHAFVIQLHRGYYFIKN